MNYSTTTNTARRTTFTLALILATATAAPAAVSISDPVLVNLAWGAIDDPTRHDGSTKEDGMASGRVELATCDGQVYMALWTSLDDTGLVAPADLYLKIQAAVSLDGGQSWVDRGVIADPALDDPNWGEVTDNAGNNDQVGTPRIACSMNGAQRNWLATWIRQDINAGNGGDRLVRGRASIDDGDNWGARVEISEEDAYTPSVTGSANGNFVYYGTPSAALGANGGDNETKRVVVGMGGALVIQNQGAATASPELTTYPWIASDGGNNLVIASLDGMGIRPDFSYASAADLNWHEVDELAQPASYSGGQNPLPPLQVACAPAPSRTCIAVFFHETFNLNCLDSAIYTARSTDGGQNWESVVIGNLPEGGCARYPSIASADNGKWLLAFEARNREALAYSLSNDDGETWTDPAELHVPDNGLHFTPAVAGAATPLGPRYVVTFSSSWTNGGQWGADNDALALVVQELCGNGVVDVAEGEECDLNAPVGGQCCDPSCLFAVAGSPCDDNDACTWIDTCATSLACVGSNPVVCQALDQCHDVGSCDQATGFCSDPVLADGVACDDGDECTQSDSCQAGVCEGSNPVVCTASDQCHGVGSCNPATGVCSDPAIGDGTACDDGDECTQSDSCLAGVCEGSNPVVCPASDQCHDVGSCDQATGFCSDPVLADGVACDDGSECTLGDTCQAGSCQAGEAPDCDDNTLCTDDLCLPISGCINSPNNVLCDDGDLCTNGDACWQGFCAGVPEDCDDADACTNDVCDPMTGQCNNPVAVFCPDDGELCNGEERCVPEAGQCKSGSWVGNDFVEGLGAAPGTACGDITDCNEERCNIAQECIWEGLEEVGTPCGDLEDLCSPSECSESGCHAVAGLDCDDQDLCTFDICMRNECGHLPIMLQTCPDLGLWDRWRPRCLVALVREGLRLGNQSGSQLIRCLDRTRKTIAKGKDLELASKACARDLDPELDSAKLTRLRVKAHTKVMKSCSALSPTDLGLPCGDTTFSTMDAQIACLLEAQVSSAQLVIRRLMPDACELAAAAGLLDDYPGLCG